MNNNIKNQLQRVTNTILHDMSHPNRFSPFPFGKKSVKDIGSGWCEEWVIEAIRIIGDGKGIWIEDILPELEGSIAHYILELKGKFYDAELIGGTMNARDLIRSDHEYSSLSLSC